MGRVVQKLKTIDKIDAPTIGWGSLPVVRECADG
jgi:hypothetical protein